MRAYALSAAVFVVAVVAAFVFWRARAQNQAAERNTRTCKLEPGAVYAFVGVGDGFATAVVDIAHPDAPCVDRNVPREARSVGVRGSDGALVYLHDKRLFEARPEKGAFSELHHATIYPPKPPRDPEIEAGGCPGKVDGFLAAPDDDRLVYWCGSSAFHDTHGKDLALDPRSERPLAVGYRGRVLGVRDRGSVSTPALFVLGPLGQKLTVANVEVRFARASVPVRAVEGGFLILVPRGLAHAHDMFRVDFDGHATRDQRYEDLPEAEVGTYDVVIGADASLFFHAQVSAGGEEAVVRLPPRNLPIEIILRPSGAVRFASADLFAAP